MKKLLAALLLVLACGGALAQGSGSVPSGAIAIGRGPTSTGWANLAPRANGDCVQVVGGLFVSAACPLTVPGGTSGQIQYNNAGSFGGFTPGGDLTFANPNFTINNGAVSNSKLAVGTANTVKGSLNGSAEVDIALPSCAADGLHAYTYTSGTGWNCTTLTTTATASIPTTATVTISNASPGVVTWAAHGLTANTPIWFCTTGSLPTGLTPCVPASGAVSANTYTANPTLYYVVGSSITTNTFTVATTVANANAGIAVNTSSAGSGTHTAFANAAACAGCIGEYVYSDITLSSLFSLTSGSAGQVWNTISLTAGIWLVGGNVGVIKTAATTPVFTHMHAGIVYGFSTIPSTPFNGATALHITSNNENGWMFTNNPEVIFLTTTTTINGTITSDFTGGTAGAYGKTWAIRIK